MNFVKFLLCGGAMFFAARYSVRYPEYSFVWLMVGYAIGFIWGKLGG